MRFPPDPGSPAQDAATTRLLVPRVATLDGFVSSSGDGVDVHGAAPMTAWVVRTRNTHYRVVAAADGQVHIQGGRFFPTATAAYVDGASTGGSLLKIGWICIGLCMELTASGQRIVTSPVVAISADGHHGQSGPAGRAH